MSANGAIRVNLVHGFEVRIGERVVRVPPAAQRLVAFVAIKQRSLRRKYVAGNLWLDSNENRAGANLRSAVWRLQRLGIPLLDSDTTHIGLGSGVVVDLAEAERAATAILDGRPPEAGCSLDRFENVWRGDLLPDWYDDWLLLERERYRQLRIHALERLSSVYVAGGRFANAIDVGLAAVEAEPLRESAHRRVIEAHLAEGNVHEARRQLDWCTQLLRNQLGLEPSPELVALCRDQVAAPA